MGSSIFEGNQFMFLVLMALVISGALRVGLELSGQDQGVNKVATGLPGCSEPPREVGSSSSSSSSSASASSSGGTTQGSGSTTTESNSNSNSGVGTATSSRSARAESDERGGSPLLPPKPLPTTGPLAGLQPWTLPPSLSKGVFPLDSTVDASKFRLHVKVLAYNRADSILRSLESLEAADYGGDTVSLTIFVDHPFSGDPAKWNDQAAKQVAGQHALLLRLDGFKWSHGEKNIIFRSQNQGIQPQWLEAWWPESLNDFALVVEDDMEVSPVYYQYFKRLLAHYYYNASNFEPHLYGISFQRQTFVAGIGGSPFHASPQPYLYQLVGTWGQFLLPLPWRSFRMWYDHRRHNQSREPVLQGLKTTQWWFNKGNRLWTPWIIKWAYSECMFNLYPAFPSNVSLSISHRDKGSNFAKNRGADSSLITAIPAKPKSPVRQWWDAGFPPVNKAQRRDLCFHLLPHYPPARQLDELNYLLEAMKLEVKRVALIIVPRGGYDLVRNWLCHVEGRGLRNFVLVVSCPRQASTLSSMGHMVYLTSGGNRTVDMSLMVRSSGVNQWTAEHVHLVLATLSFGFDTLVCSPQTIWVGNPLETDFGESYDMWGHLDPINFSDSYIYVHSTETTIAAWSRLRAAWMKAEAAGKSTALLQQAAQGWLLGRDITFQTVEGIPLERAKEKAADADLKLVVFPRRPTKEEKIEALSEAQLWVIDDYDFACKAVVCRRKK